MSPHSKKPVLRVDGEWNGRMMAKWSTGRNELFIDVTKLPIHPKSVKPVAEQPRFESRRLWKDVTYGLKVRTIAAIRMNRSLRVLRVKPHGQSLACGGPAIHTVFPFGRATYDSARMCMYDMADSILIELSLL